MEERDKPGTQTIGFAAQRRDSRVSSRRRRSRAGSTPTRPHVWVGKDVQETSSPLDHCQESSPGPLEGRGSIAAYYEPGRRVVPLLMSSSMSSQIGWNAQTGPSSDGTLTLMHSSRT